MISQKSNVYAHALSRTETENYNAAEASGCTCMGTHIPLSEEIRREIARLKVPGKTPGELISTIDDLLSARAEEERKRRLLEEIKKIEEDDDFMDLEMMSIALPSRPYGWL
ncbi:MAG TPA: hypothetical protein VE134_03035 [Methanomicrobiales archaeon]|nr:hypothetical protein [Methanomicrobiales archaeon]